MFSPLFLFSQNLVPNPSFETYIVCPYTDSIENAIPWFNPTISTPNLFNECCTVPMSFGIPNNGWGYQYPRTGQGYSGIYVFADYEQGRDYISVKLNNFLESNKKYSVGFYVSVSDNSLALGSRYAIDRMGAFLSDTLIHLNTYYIIPVIPQIENPTGHFLSDTLNWMLVSGIYTAHGGEQYLTIGNFYANDSTNYLQIANSNTHLSFYYIDDVWVSLFTDTSGINEVQGIENNISVFPNPASDNVTVSFGNVNTDKCTLELYDVIGNRVFSKEIAANLNSVIMPLDNVSKGVYICRISDANHINLYNSKLVIIK